MSQPGAEKGGRHWNVNARGDITATAGLHIEVGGIKADSMPSRIPHNLCVDVRALPNPWRQIKAGSIVETADGIADWLRSRRRAVFDQLVDSVVEELKKQRSVRVQCLGGRHRSWAVAVAAATKYDIEREEAMSPVAVRRMCDGNL